MGVCLASLEHLADSLRAHPELTKLEVKFCSSRDMIKNNRLNDIVPIGLVVRISASHCNHISILMLERGWPGFDSPIGSIYFFFFLFPFLFERVEFMGKGFEAKNIIGLDGS